MALASVAHARRVVDDILDFTRIEAGVVPCERVAFPVREVVHQAVDVVAGVAEQKGVGIAVDVPATVPAVVRGDAVKLRQVLVNLVGNAVKFTDEGSVTVQVRWGDGRAAFRIVDTGVGIEAGALDRVFGQFEQGDTTTTRRYGGTGLGLAISREFAHIMGGDLHLESHPGRGTTAVLTVPLATADEDAPTTALPPLAALPSAPEPSLEERGSADRPLVVIVDDNATNALLAGDILDEVGARSLWAPDGPAAIGILTGRDDVAALLLDSHLPGMHGDEVAHWARARCPGTRIIMLTADVSVENFERARVAGADRCLGKPAQVADVRRALQETGVLAASFDVSPIEQAYRIIAARDTARHAEAGQLIRAAHGDAAAFTEALRHDPGHERQFAAAHRNLAGPLVYAAGLVADEDRSERAHQILLQCLNTAINWEDA
jgi:CheY-like chemotaxis protein